MKIELLRVKDVFDLSNLGLVCAPFLQPAPQTPFKNFSAIVTVQPPDDPPFEVKASFNLTHFKIPELAAPVEKRWQVVTCLGEISKDSVPIGSIIFCDSETKVRLANSI